MLINKWIQTLHQGNLIFCVQKVTKHEKILYCTAVLVVVIVFGVSSIFKLKISKAEHYFILFVCLALDKNCYRTLRCWFMPK